MIRRITMIVWIVAGTGLLLSQVTEARNPIRRDFFDYYTSAKNTRLDDLPSNAGHCGVCHYDFDGGGARNHYGARIEVLINGGLSNTAAIDSLDGVDADNDGYANGVEATSILFTNTPTFPGLTKDDTLLVSNVSLNDIRAYLTPLGSNDTTPPVVTVTAPIGGESWQALSTQLVTWTASDANGIADINVYLSDDGGTSFKAIAKGEPDDGTWDWFVPNRPGSGSIIRVEARDNAGNLGHDDSPVFTIVGTPAGYVPTTMRDMDLPGTQPLTGVILDDPDVNCRTCHGDYDAAVEPWFQWKGSMMGQAQRDPLFLACVAVAEQDAPSVGDLCLRCHTPGGWMEGRSVDTGGGLMNATDRQGVQCDFCHRAVDPDYKPGISPAKDQAVLDSLETIPLTNANGMFVVDADPIKRGPFADAEASHAFLESPFHRESDICGTCHDVSNPVFVAGGSPGVYVPNAFDTEHPDGNLRNMFPIERTFSEYSVSAYPNGGVFQPQFAGNKPDGIVSSCQDCHMADVSGKGCNESGAPVRSDLPLHDLTGGNTFIPDILPMFYPSEVDTAYLQAGKRRAIAMLKLAASMALAVEQNGAIPVLKVTVTNESAHKLPSGYPEGRRVWLNVKAYDAVDNLVFESGAYNGASGVLDKTDAKVYEIKPGLSTQLGPALGLPVGESFHFVLNDTVFFDNRIPPRGFTNAAFEAIQSPPVAYTYADSQYWDETTYELPLNAAKATVRLYYQTTSKEYIEFLRDENVTNTAGIDLYNAWVAQGKNFPVTMAEDSTDIVIDPTPVGPRSLATTALYENVPNPFNPSTTIRYSLATRQRVRIDVFDVSGARVATLVDDVRPAGQQQITWWGLNADGARVASGVYLIRMHTAEGAFTRKAVMVK